MKKYNAVPVIKALIEGREIEMLGNVYKFMRKGEQFEADGEWFETTRTDIFLKIQSENDNGKIYHKWTSTFISLAAFIELCESVSDEEIDTIAAVNALHQLRD